MIWNLIGRVKNEVIYLDLELDCVEVDLLVVLEAVGAQLVIDLALARVAEHLIRLADALETPFGIGVVWVLVRMPVAREPVVGHLDLLVRGCRRYAELFVQVAAARGRQLWLKHGV